MLPDILLKIAKHFLVDLSTRILYYFRASVYNLFAIVMHKINKTCLYSLFSVCRPHPDVRSRIRGRCCYLLSITFSEPINSVISMNFECHPIDMLNVFFLLAVVNCSGFVHQAQQRSGWSIESTAANSRSKVRVCENCALALAKWFTKNSKWKLAHSVSVRADVVVYLSLSAFVIF